MCKICTLQITSKLESLSDKGYYLPRGFDMQITSKLNMPRPATSTAKGTKLDKERMKERDKRLGDRAITTGRRNLLQEQREKDLAALERMKALEAQRLSSRQTKIYTIGKVTVCTDNPTHAEEFEKLKGEQWAKIKNIRI